jgi:ribonuclease P protein component
MDFSFGKEFRLLKPKDFQYLKKGASRIDTPFLRFYFKSSQIRDLAHARLGLSISKKSGNAVRRNLIKRRVREVFRTEFFRSSSLDILVIASPRLKGLNSVDFKSALDLSLEKALKKAKEHRDFK